MKMVFHNKNPKYSQKMENSCTQGNNNRNTLVTMSRGSAHFWPLLHLLTALLFLNTRANLPNDEVLATTCLWPPLLQTPMRNRPHSWAEAAQERWLTRGLNTNSCGWWDGSVGISVLQPYDWVWHPDPTVERTNLESCPLTSTPVH